MNKVLRGLGTAAAVVAVLVIALLLIVWMGLRASLPALDGSLPLTRLSAPVRIQRDAGGVPTITAANREDLARGLGFVHAQERFFQMDLMRRAAAGELSALLGPGLLPADRQLRLHRFRRVAHASIEQLDATHRAVLNAYVEGVNAGLAALSGRPFEYWLLRSKPVAWSAEDSLLCVYAMFLQLQDPRGAAQLQRGLLHDTLPAPLWRFVSAGAPEWESAVDGSRPDEPIVPSAQEVDLRTQSDMPANALPETVRRQLSGVGSNNWAVAGRRSSNGAAVIANDMHLGYRVPLIWYRARLVLDAAQLAPERGSFDVTGVTLPGAPSVAVGSNGSVAWGFTNSYGEFESVIRLVPVPGRADAYQTATGPRTLDIATETIEVRGGTPETLRIPMTPWGPVVGQDWDGRPYVLDWTAHDPQAANLNLLQFEHVRSVQEAVALAPTIGIPGQNLMLADKDGHIAWTIAGRLPLRDKRRPPERRPPDLPSLSTDPNPGFDGWVAAADQPRLIDPEGGLLWSANARVVGGPAADLIGDAGMDRGARAAQIHADLLAAPQPFTPAASLAVQLDDRALFLERWRTVLNDLLGRAPAAGDHHHDATRTVLGGWSGHAAPTDAAYRLVRQFRSQVEARVFYMLVGPAQRRAPTFEFEIPSAFEGPLWRLIQQRPLHLLAARYRDWDDLLLESLTAAEVVPAGCPDLAGCVWGKANTVRIHHPMSKSLPALARWLDMPAVAVPGGREDMPRVQGPDYGASERFSVSPGHEQDGYFHMPGGQSGHPLSPFYRSDFDAWATGRPAPFLPGAERHRLTLTR